MKITGFSFIRNAIKYQYPIAEAIQSILPLCDEVVVAVGASEDGTRELVTSIHPQKIKIIDTVWDENLKEGGRILAQQTNLAFQAIGQDSDWCIYIQGDEVMHENGHSEVYEAMKLWKDDEKVEGLLFNYLHFFGSYDYIGVESHWYRHEIRAIKNDKQIFSYRDAQGFRKQPNQKLRVKPVNAFIHHYGWVQDPRTMKSKMAVKEKIYNGHDAEEGILVVPDDYAHSFKNVLKPFEGTHPKVIQERIRQINWPFNYDTSKNKIKWKDRFKNLIEKVTGKRPFDHNNYRVI